MDEPTRRQVSPGVPVERVRGEHPDDPAWRADALAKSRHSRLLDELRAPDEDHDRERAEVACAEAARSLLRDFAPALLLLPAAERLRVQALAAYARLLFDFATQPGLEGERLAQLNRLEFDLEEALAGRPRGQPVFVQMARIEELRGWSRDALDRIVAAARLEITRPAAEGDRRARAAALGAALAEALVGPGAAPELEALAAAALRLRGFPPPAPHLGAMARGEAAPTDESRSGAPDNDDLEERLRPLPIPSSAGPYRRAARFLRLAVLALADRSRPGRPPVLGAWRRIALLLRARLSV